MTNTCTLTSKNNSYNFDESLAAQFDSIVLSPVRSVIQAPLTDAECRLGSEAHDSARGTRPFKVFLWWQRLPVFLRTKAGVVRRNPSI